MLEWVWKTNVVTAFNAARAVLPVMLAHGRGRIPEHIAATVRFLCSDEAAAITGATIPL